MVVSAAATLALAGCGRSSSSENTPASANPTEEQPASNSTNMMNGGGNTVTATNGNDMNSQAATNLPGTNNPPATNP